MLYVFISLSLSYFLMSGKSSPVEMMNSFSISISSSCVIYNSYSPRTEFVGLKKFTLNLKSCGLRVHDLSLSCWGV